MGNDEVLLQVEHLSKKFCRDLKRSLWYGVTDITGEILGRRGPRTNLRTKEFWALKDVSFELRRGQALGLIGRNGAGKSTLLKLLNGLIPPDQGRIAVRGSIGALIALGAGFNPVLTGRENVLVNASILGIPGHRARSMLDDIVDFAELEDFIDAPLQSYSSGMVVRLGFAVATAMNPDILLLDEVLAVGDAAFRAKCFQRMGEVMRDSAVVFVSHSMPHVARVCDTGLLLRKGEVAAVGSIHEVVDQYQRDLDQAHRSRPTQVLGNGVRAASLTLSRDRVRYGDHVDAILDIDAERDLENGLSLIGFHTVEGWAGQANITEQLSHLREGANSLRIRLGPLHLRQDVYYISFSITDAGGKRTRVHGIAIAELRVDSDIVVDLPYQIPTR